MSFHRSAAFLVALAMLAPSTALAKDVAVTPFVPKAGLDALIALNITSLVSSELDFMSQYDMAEQLDDMPKGMNAACVTNVGCLKTVGAAVGTDQMVSGTVQKIGEQYDITMVLYDNGTKKLVRKTQFKVATDPMSMADTMGTYVHQLVTGESRGGDGAQADAVSDDDFDMFDDDFDDIDFDSMDDGGYKGKTVATPTGEGRELSDFDEDDQYEQEQAARKAREREEALARQEADAAAERKAEAERRKKAEAAEKKRKAELAAQREREEADRLRREKEEREAQARRDAERAEAEREALADVGDDDDFGDITFGSVDPDDIEVEIDDIEFGTTTSDIKVGDDFSRPPSDYSSSGDYDDLDDFDDLDDLDYTPSRSTRSDDDDDRPTRSRYDEEDALASLDERDSIDDDRSRSKGTSSGSRATIETDNGDHDPKLGLTLRGGYSRFQVFDFITYGAELSIPVQDTLYVHIGMEGFSTERTIPEALRDQYDGATTKWNTIMPVNLGLAYQPTRNKFRPYIGADLTFTPYTSNFKIAPGARARTGFDLMLAEGFGLNLNLSGGVWYGKEFNTIQADVEPFGVVPQISGGTKIRF